jgi:hypothetical protein
VPLDDGGQQLLDYTIWYDQGINLFAILEENVQSQPYLAENLTKGSTYQFKVQARNVVGLSELSSEYSIIAATEPDTPLTPVTSLTNNDVTISWTQPSENG